VLWRSYVTRWYNRLLFNFVQRLIFSKARRFGSRLCFRLQVKKAPTLVDPIDRAIISHWALKISKRVKICPWEQILSVGFMVFNLFIGQALFFVSASSFLIFETHFLVTVLEEDCSQVHILTSILIFGAKSLKVAPSKGSTSVKFFLYLRAEAEPACEMSCLMNNYTIDKVQNKKIMPVTNLLLPPSHVSHPFSCLSSPNSCHLCTHSLTPSLRAVGLLLVLTDGWYAK
jgi:hypothetical protein